MKKFLSAVAAVIAAVVLAVCFASCATNYVGTYKLDSIHMDMGGLEVNVKVGEEYEGVTLKPDLVVLEVKDDNTYTISMSMGESITESGTWSVNDEGKLVLENAGQEMVAQNEGSMLVIEQSTSGGTVSMTLKKQ